MNSAFGTEPSSEIVDRARHGDPAAHHRLYQLYAAPVYNLGRRLLIRPDLADDLLQETFVEVIQHMSAFRGDAPVGMWIRKVAVNKCLSYLRSAWYRRRDDLDADTALDGPALPGNGGIDTATLDLEEALAALPALSRLVVWLHDVEGYTHEEIGRALGRSASFSKSRLARAHVTLRDALTGAGDTAPCMQISQNC